MKDIPLIEEADYLFESIKELNKNLNNIKVSSKNILEYCLIEDEIKNLYHRVDDLNKTIYLKKEDTKDEIVETNRRINQRINNNRRSNNNTKILFKLFIFFMLISELHTNSLNHQNYNNFGTFNTNTFNTNSMNALNTLFLFNALNRRRNNEI